MLSSFVQTSSRQGEIAEVVLRNGWNYMRRLLAGSKTDAPQLPTPAVLRNILVDLGPVYVKLGQLLSTRPDLLPADYIETLATLQSEVPPFPWEDIQGVLRQEVRQPLDQAFAYIATEAIAAGSIAQIHRATLKDGREVALKIQRPGIEEVVEQDIAIVRILADLASRTSLGQDYDFKALAEEFTNALRDELDFRREGSYTDQLRQNMSHSKWFEPSQLIIPTIYWELTTKNLLVMEWLEGKPILVAGALDDQRNGSAKIDRHAVTTLLFRVFFQQIYLDGFFHADPHPGNLFYMEDGRVGLLDCGMVGRLDPNTQQILTELLLAIVDLDAQRCTQLTLQLAESSPNVNLIGLENDFEKLLRRYYNRSLSEINFSHVFYEVLQVSRTNKLRLPNNLGLYAKAMANLEGAARAFNPEINLLNEVKPLMVDLFRQQLIGDQPIPTLLRTALDLKSLSLRSPRQVEQLLDRVTSETLKWNITLKDLDGVRITLDKSANRLSFSILVGSLIMGAAIISVGAPSTQLHWLSNGLFATASFLSLWLIVSILRSGKLR